MNGRTRRLRAKSEQADSGSPVGGASRSNRTVSSRASDPPEEEDDAEQEDSEVTRCICGHAELQTHSIKDSDSVDAGLFIQCDSCQVWQHGYCVGFLSDGDVPDTYYCEKCRPEYHVIVVRPNGRTSKYLPTMSAAEKAQLERTRKGSSSKPLHGNSRADRSERYERSERFDRSGAEKRDYGDSGGTGGSDDEDKRSLSKRRRRTLNSRDAEYEETLKRVLEESVHDQDRQNENAETGEKSTILKTVSDQRSNGEGIDNAMQYRKVSPAEADVQQEDNGEFPQNSSSHVPSSPASGPALTSSTSAPAASIPTAALHSLAPNHARETTMPILDSSLERVSESSGDNSREARPKFPSHLQSPKRTSKARSNTPSTKNKKRRRNLDNGDSDDKEKTKRSAATDHTLSTSRPRIPPSRSSVVDMRKRVAAILEFIGRTQADISEESDQVRFGESIQSIEALTRKLLSWEDEFGRYGE